MGHIHLFMDENKNKNHLVHMIKLSIVEIWSYRVNCPMTGHHPWPNTQKIHNLGVNKWGPSHGYLYIALSPNTWWYKIVFGICYSFNKWPKVYVWLCVATLTLGLWPRQGLAKVRTKSEARESHFMLLGGWECRRVWENKHSHSQMSSHFGSWSHGGLPNLQWAIAGVKTYWI
jgi:hypothetical protein